MSALTLLGCGPLSNVDLPLLDEVDARITLRAMLSVHGVPVDRLGDRDAMIAFTHDRALAVLAADELARRELDASYPALAAPGGIAVDGPADVVLVGVLGTDLIDVRPTRLGDPYALRACLVRPTRQHPPASFALRPNRARDAVRIAVRMAA
jgi:hypothetical protein